MPPWRSSRPAGRSGSRSATRSPDLARVSRSLLSRDTTHRLPPESAQYGRRAPRAGSLVVVTSDSKVTSGVVYKAVLLAFGLVIAGMIFQALASLVLGVLIVAIIATPLSAFADMLQRRRVPRAIGATLGLLLGLAALAGLVALIVPVFTREVNRFAASLPAIGDSLSRRLGRLTGHRRVTSRRRSSIS